MITEKPEGAPGAPETEILELNTAVLDLRNQVLYDRVGEEGMMAAADAEAAASDEKNFFDDLERSMASSAGAVALGETLKEHALDELSQDMFGKGLHELDLHDRQKLDSAQAELDTHKEAGRGANSTETLKTASEKDRLDAELNRVFNNPSSLYIYDADLQTPDTISLYAQPKSPDIIDGEGNVTRTPDMHVNLSDTITAIPTLMITDKEGIPEATKSVKFVNSQTGHEVDLNKMATDAGIPEELVAQEMETFNAKNRQPLDLETLEVVRESMQRVKAYLENQVGADSTVPREGKYEPELPTEE